MQQTTKGFSPHPNTRRRLIALAVAGAWAALTAPAGAQQASAVSTGATAPAATTPASEAAAAQATAAQTTPSTGADADAGPKVVVKGIRASLQSTLNLKRNSDGIVDGIVADDIGKFPDTNLAESLQRISGVSIDRNRGEGAQVTVRGVGPDLNMVLLNGRQMPTSNLGDLAGRAFDFSNLASESISQIQVYKSSRADTPPGGIGATINIMTGRPLDLGNTASVGAKVVYDTSNKHLPQEDKAKHSYTPEISGIYSTTWNDGMFGVAVSASYQERNLGVNTASITNGWQGPFRGDENSWGTIPQPGTAGAADIVNRPDPTDVYAVPQNISYFMRGTQRQRTNGQLTFQFRPNKDITTTLDYTYSQNKIQTKYHELSAWFNFGPSASSWTDGPIAAPLYYQENVANQDIAMNGGDYGTKSENNSLGFNAQWKVSRDLKLSLDVHHSTAESKADSPFGSENDLATVSFSRGNTRVDFSDEMPVLSIEGADFNRAPMQVSGSWFKNGYQKMKIDQVQASGRLNLMESSALNFGLSATNVENRSAFQQVQRDTWGGATTPADYPQSLWRADTLGQYFSKLGGSGNPALFQQIHLFDFAAMRQRAIEATGLPDKYSPSLADPDYDRRTTEKSRALYFQLNTEWDTALPMHTGLGFRYEKTDVTSTALSQTVAGVNWVSQNELPFVFSGKEFTTLKGDYHNLLPSLDWDMDLRPDFKVRASYGHTIGRPRYDQIQGGTTIDPTGTVNGGKGSRGNPALKPVKSKNLDLSAEWYYDKQSVVSLGLYYKKLDNYAGQTVADETSPNVTTPVGGRYWNAALASGCIVTDTNCLRNFILRTFDGEAGVTRGPDNAAGNATGTISGIPGDPFVHYDITTFVNEKAATLKGAEVNLQHMFGNSGFGIQANYTYVKSDLTFDNASKGNQFALVGLSDSANLIGIYEDAKWSIRAAYNWRDKFLSSVTDPVGPNPQYVEPYGQLDLSIGYNVSPRLALSFEAINVTDETQRVHGRHERMVLSATQSGPRYMVGARYKF
ncbi:TonB-dependent receptor [Pseudoduganella chitinolytica]|uniref:TonB-dependent receptor n=1 Tax=Pseudoduganella chitinolytica TaxID=34070 RepID=A0ABY8BG99_9BURK|nr:TonB-dependent receptor [Pseudoduganella chitinolytica]WEF34934.1 TonB-dependent receptor [Pseudoduganella chitinolytica]